MKATNLVLALSAAILFLATACGPDTIHNKDPKNEVTELTLEPSSANLLQGESVQLKATATPSDAKVTYKTDNASIATVSETGLVKGVAPGTATITAQAGNKTATCTINVAKVADVMILSKLDNKKYQPSSTIEYKASASKEEVEAYDLQLEFTVLKSADYKFELAFEKPTSGSVCLGECVPLDNETHYTKDIRLTADAEEAPYEKEKGATTPLATHIYIPNPTAGQTYTNKITITLTPKAGGEALVWTVNLAVQVK